ncbi:heavy metal translocating P-type ATPase [Prosthecomicrobium pneumaticum]|uniref:Cu2+-exporting ATPase n=1 Tax=Prosthecomicrobium pneumaticum TaxID=81895 RepID=A0A7W9CW93_9HYPH|nr:heavy metal translocating P-type ATPase [Prosthecomicrobium pneumaticum]MBB5752716.1 Cu2+-exporting ATPase [Prosthecomicrobium pneumaticum]
MSCCAPGAEVLGTPSATLPEGEELLLASRSLGNGERQVELAVPDVHCGACIHAVETALRRVEGVTGARVNLSTRRVAVRWREGLAPPPVAAALAAIGYPPHLFEDEAGRDRTLSELLRAVAVAGFAAGNVMLLSVSVWSGAEGATRDLFHWISALIALPALVFAGRIYYRSAFNALRHGRMNMDVPIAIGVSLAYAMSLYETLTHGAHAYFDASVSLLFFLLIGRTLDHVMRDRARAAVRGLSRLMPRGAVVLAADGGRDYRPVETIEPGMRLLIAAGERIPVDARVIAGTSDLDCALVTGESRPQPVEPGAAVRAGTLNLSGPLTLEAERPASASFLAEMVRMMEAAEGGRARYRRIAERVSALYAPVVHLTAFVTFLGWMAVDGDWHKAITVAIAVLIITCPCALGLAVPIVQVVAARRLFENGVMVKDGAGLERLAEADAVVFDKTGTLTLGRPRLVGAEALAPELHAIASALAAHSRHPLSEAIAEAAPRGVATPVFETVAEHPGLGLEGRMDGRLWRLGRAAWAAPTEAAEGEDGTVLAEDGVVRARFHFADALRPGAREAVATLARTVGPVTMLSGDAEPACRAVAAALGIADVAARLMPGDKVARLAAMAAGGRKVLMVGDGLNDAPALGAAHVSMAPATAADIGRNAADFVFLRDSLAAVPVARAIARRAGRLIRQNLALAIVYNVIAVPIAILGHVTPLVAAIAMSASSLLVIGNALRLAGGPGEAAAPVAPAPRRNTLSAPVTAR